MVRNVYKLSSTFIRVYLLFCNTTVSDKRLLRRKSHPIKGLWRKKIFFYFWVSFLCLSARLKDNTRVTLVYSWDKSWYPGLRHHYSILRFYPAFIMSQIGIASHVYALFTFSWTPQDLNCTSMKTAKKFWLDTSFVIVLAEFNHDKELDQAFLKTSCILSLN